MITFTQAAARLHLSPADFAQLRRTYPLPCVQGKGGPLFDLPTLDTWYARLPVRPLIELRKNLATQTHQRERDRVYLMRLWGCLRQVAPPLGDPKPRLLMRGQHFTLFDARGETRFTSLSQAIDGLKLALRLARTRSLAVLKAA